MEILVVDALEALSVETKGLESLPLRHQITRPKQRMMAPTVYGPILSKLPVRLPVRAVVERVSGAAHRGFDCSTRY